MTKKFLEMMPVQAIAKILVENFDRLGGTNCKDEIWFTLKPQQE